MLALKPAPAPLEIVSSPRRSPHLAPAPDITLFGLTLTNANVAEALDRLLAPGRRTAAFVNAHCINVAAKDGNYRAALGKADMLLPDGAGLAIAARMQRRRFRSNLNGTDLFLPLCHAAARRDLSVYFLGSAEGVAEAAAATATIAVPGLRIAGCQHGFASSDEAVIAAVNASGAAIVLVAMGVPKQELWIANHRERLDAQLVMGVGAQFDFWSGRMPRAPKAYRRIGLEWLYRLMQEPRRMFARYVLGNPVFLARAAWDAIIRRRPRYSSIAMPKPLSPTKRR